MQDLVDSVIHPIVVWNVIFSAFHTWTRQSVVSGIGIYRESLRSSQVWTSDGSVFRSPPTFSRGRAACPTFPR